MKKFLILNPFGIGDVLFTTQLIRAIKDSDPKNRVSYWCNERVKEIFESNPYVNKVFAISRGDLKKIYQRSFLEGVRRTAALLTVLRREKFDMVFDFSLDHRYSLICKILGIKRRVGFNFKNRGRFLTDRITIDGYNDKHMVQYYSDLLRFADIQPKHEELDLFVSPENEAKARGILGRAGVNEMDLLVGIVPGAGASWGKQAGLKHWPSLKFAQLADKIMDNLGVKVVILGDISEKTISEVVLSAMKNKPLDLTGRMGLGELAAVIKKLKLLVTNDGGLLHMAVALGVKTVSIFGPVNESVYGPYPMNPKHAVIKKELPCRPCYRQFKIPLCDHDRECIKSITVEEVYEAARRLL